jgi:hypothetical protein
VTFVFFPTFDYFWMDTIGKKQSVKMLFSTIYDDITRYLPFDSAAQMAICAADLHGLLKIGCANGRLRSRSSRIAWRKAIREGRNS